MTTTATTRPAPQATLFELTPDQAAQVRAAASSITALPNEEADLFCRQALDASFDLPVELRKAVLNFSDAGSDTGVMVVRGLYVDEDLVDTPLENSHGLAGKTEFVKEMGAIAHLLGTMVGYEAENGGRLIQDMVPNPKLAMTQQSQSSKVELEAHTEQCFSEYKPDYVVLGALRGDPNAFTYCYGARKFVEHFTADELRQLREPRWMTQIDDSFKPFIPDPNAVRGPYPIITGPEDDPYILIDQDLMHGVTKDAQELLDKVVQTYVAHRDGVALQAGDLLMLDNPRAMHGRSMYSPRFDGKDRFIARGFVVRDRRRLWPWLLDDRRTVAAMYS